MQRCFIILNGKITFIVKTRKAKTYIIDHTEALFSVTLGKLLGLIVINDKCRVSYRLQTLPNSALSPHNKPVRKEQINI